MKIPVLVEPVAGNGFRAHSGEPLSFTAEGATREDALRRLQQLIDSRLKTGAIVVDLEVGGTQNPLLAMAGMFKDDPYFDEWQEAIAEYRRQVDEDPNAL